MVFRKAVQRNHFGYIDRHTKAAGDIQKYHEVDKYPFAIRQTTRQASAGAFPALLKQLKVGVLYARDSCTAVALMPKH